MDPRLMSILIALAVVALGVALLIEHRLTSRLMAIFATVAAGAVALSLLLT